MNRQMTQISPAFIAGVFGLAAIAALSGCKDAGGDGHGHDATKASTETTAAPTNRIDVPDSVRKNLGITFVKAERRNVAATIRLPGRFELPPSARREYRTVLPSRVELLVKQYDRVEPGRLLARLDSPEWRRVQHEAVEAEGEIKVAEAGVDVAEAAAAENAKAVALLRQRTAALAEANAPRAELTAELALAEGKSARLAAEVRAAKVRVAEAKEHYASRLRVLASVVGIPKATLLAPATRPAGTDPATQPETAEEVEPLWRTIETVEVRATSAGVIESLAVTTGGWAEAGGLVLTVVDPAAVRFRATALQADLGRLRDGGEATIVAPLAGRSPSEQQRASATRPASVSAAVALALEANPSTRTLELVLTPRELQPWGRPGVTAFAEVVTAGTGGAEVAIPVAAVIQDELTKVFYRRDLANPDKVIRVEADLGVSDGRWIVVESGLKAGDEVVLDGVYELKLAGAAKTGGGKGHFHADGTWHAEGTPEPAGKK